MEVVKIRVRLVCQSLTRLRSISRTPGVLSFTTGNNDVDVDADDITFTGTFVSEGTVVDRLVPPLCSSPTEAMTYCVVLVVFTWVVLVKLRSNASPAVAIVPCTDPGRDDGCCCMLPGLALEVLPIVVPVAIGASLLLVDATAATATFADAETRISA